MHNAATEGHFGIVDSGEGYQKLMRFLFGDVRADYGFDVEKITLPRAVQEKFDTGCELRASFHIECTIAIRCLDVPIHSRPATEGSASFRECDQLVGNDSRKKTHPGALLHFLKKRSACKRVSSEPGV